MIYECKEQLIDERKYKSFRWKISHSHKSFRFFERKSNFSAEHSISASTVVDTSLHAKVVFKFRDNTDSFHFQFLRNRNANEMRWNILIIKLENVRLQHKKILQQNSFPFCSARRSMRSKWLLNISWTSWHEPKHIQVDRTHPTNYSTRDKNCFTSQLSGAVDFESHINFILTTIAAEE